MKDLFGNEITESEYLETRNPHAHESTYQRFKRENEYRKAGGSSKCGNCGNHIAGDYHNKRYHKCNLIGISHGSATDIRIGHVCNRWHSETA